MKQFLIDLFRGICITAFYAMLIVSFIVGIHAFMIVNILRPWEAIVMFIAGLILIIVSLLVMYIIGVMERLERENYKPSEYESERKA